jgi:hypothetical protein
VTLCVWAVSSLVAWVIGPFGTFYSMREDERLFYWTVVIGLSILISALVRAIVLELVSPKKPVTYSLATISGVTLVFSPIVYCLSSQFGGGSLSQMVHFSEIVLYVAIISSAVHFVRSLVPGIEDENLALFRSPMVIATKSLPRLSSRLANPQSKVIRLSARDHFVDVVTDQEIETLRMRLADAVLETEPVEGFCCHRSHWVAARFVVGARKADGKAWLVLENGDEVPVSRKYRSNAIAAGWDV